MNIYLESFIVYLSSYLISYLILEMIQSIMESHYPEKYKELKKDVWIRLYCVIAILVIHYIWLYCQKFHKERCGKHSYFLFPILFLIPIYSIFFINYYEYRWGESSSQENEKINRILTHVMLLLFVFNTLFVFLPKKWQRKALEVVNVIMLFEVL